MYLGEPACEGCGTESDVGYVSTQPGWPYPCGMWICGKCLEKVPYNEYNNEEI